MARYVVLEFEDNTEADAFVEAFKNRLVYHAVPETTLEDRANYRMVTNEKAASVVGYFMRPMIPCTCPPSAKGRQIGYSRGTKYGLWVHASCGKPNRLQLEAWGRFLGLGRNLLSDDPLVEGLLRIDGSTPSGAIREPNDWRILGKRPNGPIG